MVGVAVLTVTLLVAVVLLAGGDDTASPDESSGPDGSGGECTNVHDGHNMMMWNPVMADEMTDVGCPWPYAPFDVPYDLMAFDGDAIAATFEARRYDELWHMFGTLDAGVCEVRALPDEPGGGFAFGFTYAVGAPGCPDRSDAVEVEVREYASALARDAAAREVSGSLVLGRWVVALNGGDGSRSDELRSAMVALGAVAA